MKSLRHIYRLGLKELISFRYDIVLIILMVYCFTVMVIVPSSGTGLQMRNAAVAIVDEDKTALSERIIAAIGPPYFKTPLMIEFNDTDQALNRGDYVFIVDIPPRFQQDVLAGKNPAIGVNIDATAIAHAKIGTNYLMNIISDEVNTFLHEAAAKTVPPVSLVIRAKYNPNRISRWFLSLVFLTHMITLLSILLPAAALIKERERGTVEHLLVMPLHSFEISLAKVWANSLLVIIGTMLSLFFCVKWIIGTPIMGSTLLYFAGTAVYLFAATELGIFMATIAKNLPQVGLLSMPVIVPLAMLDGGTTPLEAMPLFLQRIMYFSPTAHFMEFSGAVLLRNAGICDVWVQLAAMAGIGIFLFAAALMRFRATFR